MEFTEKMTNDVHPRCPEQLTSEHQEQFAKNGFLAFEEVVSPRNVADIEQKISGLIRVARKRGLAFVSGEGNPREAQCKQRHHFYIQYGAGTDVDSLVDDTAEDHVRKLMWFADEEPFWRWLVTEQPRIKMILEGVLGKDPILMQSMALIKPARYGVRETVHQDSIAFAVDPPGAIVGIWIAVDDATVENACMHVFPGCHNRGPLLHVDGEVDPSRADFDQVLPVQLSSGAMLITSGLIPHFTPPNTSSLRRRAVQFHFRSRSSRLMSCEQYISDVFVEDGGLPAGANPIVYKHE